MPVPSTKSLGPALARVLDYPNEDWETDALDAAESLEDRLPEAARSIRRFVAEGRGLGIARLMEVHDRTFDLNPACVPYLSVHAFGEESFKRAGLMTGLDAAYEKAGFERGPELPDHLAVVLRFAPHFSDDEWTDLCALCLKPALDKMTRSLAAGNSPYRHVIAALRSAIDAEPTPEVADA